MPLKRMGLKGLSKVASKCGVAASLFASLFLSTGCFQEDQPKSRNLQLSNLGPEAIWPLGKAGVPNPSIRSIAAENLYLASEARDYQRGIPNSPGEPFAFYSSYPPGLRDALLHSANLSPIGGSTTGFRSSQPQLSTFPEQAASALFSKPFGLLFASLFKKTGVDSNTLAEAADDTRNPFREAKQADSRTAVAPAKAAAADPSPADTTSSDAKADANSTGAPNAITAPVPQEPRFVFIGDFDGSGILKVMQARRVNDATFAFSDAQRAFTMFANPSAVDNQRSFAVDDVNGDGLADLLVTSHASLFGGVLLGDGTGDFRLVDTFLTGYEPVIPTLGSSVNGVRDIVTVNARNGAISTFRAAGHYKPYLMMSLDFLPDYVGHLVSLQDGLDYLMAARGGSPEILYRWNSNGRLEDAGVSLPGDPTATLNEDPGSQSLLGALQIYQVGPYASVTLTNSRLQSFNVANMKLWPNIFLAIGDLTRQGTLDVAVAFLVASTPNN